MTQLSPRETFLINTGNQKSTRILKESGDRVIG